MNVNLLILILHNITNLYLFVKLIFYVYIFIFIYVFSILLFILSNNFLYYSIKYILSSITKMKTL